MYVLSYRAVICIQIIPALRFVRTLKRAAFEELSPRRFLEAARNTNDDMIFYTGMFEWLVVVLMCWIV
jgi:hypothetical protein